MKYLHDYLNPMVTALLAQHGGFYAFSDMQFEKERIEGLEYRSLGGGLLAPKDKAFRLMMDMDVKYKEAIEMDIEENGFDGIIKRELLNYEAYHTMDIDETVAALREYGINYNRIRNVFRAELTRVSQL